MNFDIMSLLTTVKLGANVFVKVALLILIALYAIFTFMLVTKLRSLNKIVFLPAESGEGLLRFFAILYFLAVVSLFLITLVIV